MKDALEAGAFDDADRMERLDTLFADRYLDAVAARSAGRPATASWELTFAAAQRWRPLVLQHLLVGINAHINLDLGIAAARLREQGDVVANLEHLRTAAAPSPVEIADQLDRMDAEEAGRS